MIKKYMTRSETKNDNTIYQFSERLKRKDKTQ